MMNRSLLTLALGICVCAGIVINSAASAGTVMITSPTNGTVVASPVTVSAQTDSTTCNSGFNHLQVLVNGITTYQGGGDCAISAPVSVPQGIDALNVQAIAWDGTLMAQATISVTVGQQNNGLFVSTTGSDANPGTAQLPFRTIRRAAQAATAGTTVFVEPGTYAGDVYVTTPGVTYLSVVKWGAVLVPPVGSSTTIGFWNDHAANVTIDGFLVDGGGANAGQWRIGIYCDATNCVIQNSKVVNIATASPAATNGNGGAGIQIDGYLGESGGLIRSNVVGNVGRDDPSANTRHCIYLSAYGTTVQNNIIYGCHEGFGIESWHGASHLNISNNLIFASVRGIEIGSGDISGPMYSGGNDYTMVFNNIVADGDYSDPANTFVGVTEAADPNTGGSIGPHNRYSDNCVSMAGAWGLLFSTHVNDAQGTPSFVDYQPDGSGDYHLADGSWCTDQGIAALGGAAAPPTDFDGVSRPAGPAYDIGPYERTNTFAPAQMWNPARADNRLALNGVTAAAINGNYTFDPVFTSYGATSGKYYWETEIDTPSIYDTSVGIGNLSSGITDDQFLGSDGNSLGYFIYGPLVFNGSIMAYLPPYGSGTRICHALDLDNHKYWVRVGAAGTWNNNPVANPATDTGGFALPASFWSSPVGPAVNLYTPSDAVTGYFTPPSWIGISPSGFGAF
jgi:hypothetical protein